MCKPRMPRSPLPADSHDHNSETVNAGLINISKNSGDGPDATDVIIYIICGILCIMVVKWIKKACNRRLSQVQNLAPASAPAPQQPVQPMPSAPQIQAPAIQMQPLSVPALPQPAYSVVFRPGHGREEATIVEDSMQKYR